ncbi:MAG TPA: hypothetical protein VFK65_23825, partial [Candidatus Binatia bacterium]|nr:hypothetical protein [Candidatus Binatia bacterium]
GDAYPNSKFIYYAVIDRRAADLILNEGQRLTGITADERFNYKFANILGAIVEDFIIAGLWPSAVDNFRSKKLG